MSSMANRFYNKFVNQRNILKNLTYSKIREYCIIIYFLSKNNFCIVISFSGSLSI